MAGLDAPEINRPAIGLCPKLTLAYFSGPADRQWRRRRAKPDRVLPRLTPPARRTGLGSVPPRRCFATRTGC